MNSIRRTSSVVTFGEFTGSWNTTTPSLSRAGVDALNPLRNKSETALPSETPRNFACRAASSKTSLSSVNVVLSTRRCFVRLCQIRYFASRYPKNHLHAETHLSCP